MDDLRPIHGGTDAGPEPAFDFSTNATPLPPPAAVLAAVRRAPRDRYPDPAYAAIREEIADHHGVSPERVVVGAGASELIFRFILRYPGPVAVPRPTFSEYARCARMLDRPLIETDDPADLLAIDTAPDGLAFLCWPNNPTGACLPPDLIAELSHRHRLVLDLAYQPLMTTPPGPAFFSAAARAIHLHAPNKAFGLTGIRAAYAILPQADARLQQLAPSWPLGVEGEAFLRATLRPEARRWLAESRTTIAAWRGELVRDLRRLAVSVRESPATFVLARVGPATAVARSLREAGLRVRDATSFGLPEHIRIRCAPPAARHRLISALAPLLKMHCENACCE